MATLTIQQAFDLALQHHRAGRLQQAEQIYRQILAQQAEHVSAMHGLGIIAHQTGQYDMAVDLIRRAIALKPDYAEAYGNLGNALTEKRQLDEAIAAYRQAIALRPNYPEAHSNLGNALRDTGQLDQAISACRQAIALTINFPEAHNNLGNALTDNGQFDEAVAAYRQAIALRPGYAQAHLNVGNVLKNKGQLDEAITAYRQAISVKPDYADAHSNLGQALRDRGKTDEAIAACQQAIAIKPNFPEAYSNLGNALADKGQFDEAIAAYLRAIDLNPNLASAHSNLGTALQETGQLDKAIASYRQAMTIKPSYAQAHSNLIFALHFHADYDAPAIAEEHRRWNHQHAQSLRELIQGHTNDRSPDRRLRIGYVGDLGDHPVGRFILPLLAAHDRNAFEIFCYAQVRVPDKMTAKLQAHADVWRSIVGQSDEQAAELIRQDRIDILVDLAMHSGSNRLLVFARKPAPVQVTYLAYAGGTALDTIDYRLTDRYLDPETADDGLYMEKSVRLTGTYWCYQQSIKTPLVNELPAQSTGYITFACLNNFGKVSRNTLEVWAKLLQAIPNARLLLHCPVGNHRAALTRFLDSRGIAPDRLELVARLSPEQYFQTYHRADIGLDPFPYAGGTTTCDALWMGVPVVTLAGRTAVGRAGVSILSNAGLPEMIAHSTEQYLKIATDLANDLPHLAQLRSRLRQQMESSPLMDASGFTRNIEAAYRRMWRTWCQTSFAKS